MPRKDRTMSQASRKRWRRDTRAGDPVAPAADQGRMGEDPLSSPSLGPSRVRDSNREQPLRHSPPHTFRSSKRFWAILTRVVQTRTIGEPHSGNAATRHWHGSSGPQIKGDKMKRVLALGSALVVFGLTGTVGAAASPPSPAPCTLGALNMLHDATMATIPMTHDAAQGNAGMSTAVAVSGCK